MVFENKKKWMGKKFFNSNGDMGENLDFILPTEKE
tara:strand:+ start:3928 stop:4032 length:105 start_codon:yes stop_codon:yes gene_type:complete